MNDGPVLKSGFNGLTRAQPALPASWYIDPAHHDREMAQIWGRNWVYLCRAETLAGPRAFRTFDIAGQPVLIVRDAGDALKGFFNTCRHRGSILCTQAEGTLKKELITCPYHQWTYDLKGRLRATGPMRPVVGFERADHPLLPIAVAEWGGFVFVNLDPKAAAFETLYGAETTYVANWPLAEMRVGHTYSKSLNCNWKIFWENFNECLHCPNIHPELCDLVPIYGRAIMARRDDPDWQAHADDMAPHVSGGLRDGAETWSMDGAAQGTLPGLTEDDLVPGQRYVTVTPSCFFAHHRDHVRAVRITPTGPETMELSAEWLFHPDLLAQPGFDLARITDFGTLVMEQDGAACALNQAGLRARPFGHGVLMQEEYEVFLFQDWVRGRLGEPMRGQGAASRASRRAEHPNKA
ncbi:Anthranilate 1,2-dioxygenase large subunit [Defluviimonas aquaemixtae]|uniref:Anthranilate 1,2-dioxygenase large subunit n=1 Tax=Albidovulum aquaemixtae TaxID=1542388 RepID=A0A2R8B3U9_9RHOB|nr:aromatic ring-hydroxylating dioxygenase subunit alpha [Defluviimonas aquaemixtae]SPH17265.1 Anthranilate 1,2-dioxygenase large subunit [Defluviimonas aquaemixtae]